MLKNQTSKSKFHALLNLKSALIEERYEECAQWISAAFVNHAKKREVIKIINNPFMNLENTGY